jgi:glycolate oxidase iron-sulfur subunit
MSTATPAHPLSVVALADRCVQCGLCLPACPTYGHDRTETESPRGRIALARAWELGTVEATVAGDAHLDHCLGCRSCEAACPAGVEYGALLRLARERQRDRRGATALQRALEWLLGRPRWVDRLLDIYRRAYPLVPAPMRRLPRPPAVMPHSGAAAHHDDTAALFAGCVANRYEAPARAALAELCAAAGVGLEIPPDQGCCGSVHAHAGSAVGAAALAARNRQAFAGRRRVLTIASGCHESVAAAVPDAVDALAFLDARRDRLHFAEHRERVALHLPCTQRNVVGSTPALRRLLGAVPGLELVELDAGFGCCGAAGTAMLTEPARAADYRRPLLEQLAASGATRLLSANIGCRLHLANGTAIPVQHPLELLAAALRPDPLQGQRKSPVTDIDPGGPVHGDASIAARDRVDRGAAAGPRCVTRAAPASA